MVLPANPTDSSSDADLEFIYKTLKRVGRDVREMCKKVIAEIDADTVNASHIIDMIRTGLPAAKDELQPYNTELHSADFQTFVESQMETPPTNVGNEIDSLLSDITAINTWIDNSANGVYNASGYENNTRRIVSGVNTPTVYASNEMDNLRPLLVTLRDRIAS